MDMDMVAGTSVRGAATSSSAAKCHAVEVTPRRPPSWRRHGRGDGQGGGGDSSSSGRRRRSGGRRRRRRRGPRVAAEDGGDVAQPAAGDVGLPEEVAASGGVRGAHGGAGGRAGASRAGSSTEGEEVGGDAASEADEHVAVEGAKVVGRRHEVV